MYRVTKETIGGIIECLISSAESLIALGATSTIWKSLMKVGDLVRWTHPPALDFGVVIAVEKRWEDAGLSAFVRWFKYPQHNGYYPINGHYLELVNENR